MTAKVKEKQKLTDAQVSAFTDALGNPRKSGWIPVTLPGGPAEVRSASTYYLHIRQAATARDIDGEDVMLKLDAMDEEALADRVRDVMDALWQDHLTDAEHEQLNARTQEEAPIFQEAPAEAAPKRKPKRAWKRKAAR